MNAIIGLKLCDQYILCLRNRSFELYPLPSLQLAKESESTNDTSMNRPTIPLALHGFPDRTFREASMSQYNAANSTISILLLDVLHGLYLYQVRLMPMFQVVLLAKHCLGPKEGFVGAFSLGPEGKRGVWVERRRVNTQRSIFTFTTPQHSEEDCAEDSKALLNGKAVYEKKSYDLRGAFFRRFISTNI